MARKRGQSCRQPTRGMLHLAPNAPSDAVKTVVNATSLVKCGSDSQHQAYVLVASYPFFFRTLRESSR